MTESKIPISTCRPLGATLRKVRSLPFRPSFGWPGETDSESRVSDWRSERSER